MRTLFSRVCLWAWLICVAGGVASGQSVLDRLSGFDEARVTKIAPWLDEATFAEPSSEPLGVEAAKLLYQVNRLASGGLSAARAESDQKPIVGEIVAIRGKAATIESWQLPDSLADVLEFKTIYRVKIIADSTTNERDAATANETATSSPTWFVLTTKIPATWLRDNTPAENRQTSGTGVLIRSGNDSQTAVVAVASLSWLATAGPDVPADWALLGSRGFDVSLLEGVRSRDRQELKLADSSAFYPLLQIAETLDSSPSNGAGDAVPAPATLPAADLLKKSTEMIGRRVRLDLQTVRITRIAVTEEVTKQRLQSDHYWQIDALGDLGNVVIKIDAKEGEDALFENRYPVSVATRTLPAFLLQAMNEGNAGTATEVAMVSRPVVVEGIYYRLWSYESDFMKQHGGGNQFGPLVLASRITAVGGVAAGGSGAAGIGKYVAGFAIVGILAAALGSFYASRRDSVAKKRSRRSLPDQLAE
jgi:hypothetical protein